MQGLPLSQDRQWEWLGRNSACSNYCGSSVVQCNCCLVWLCGCAPSCSGLPAPPCHAHDAYNLTAWQTCCCVGSFILHRSVLACNGFQAEHSCVECRKRHALRIGTAPEPSDIVWENLQITTAQRLQRRMFILAVNVVIIFVGASFCACVHAPCQHVMLRSCCRSGLYRSCRGNRVYVRQQLLCTSHP